MTGEEILRYLSPDDIRTLCELLRNYKWEAIERLLRKKIPE